MPADNRDIDEFVGAEPERCLESGKLAVNDRYLVLETQNSLLRGAQGMLLSVALQIKALCLERTDADIREAIAHLPRSLSEIHNLILVKATAMDTVYQKRIFELVVAACRPLTTEKMREALSVVPGHAIWDP
ncbi:hypothetical protein BDW68DRAFT_177531 [Aspergillus falconensis]